jgi:hypothetical protein
VLVLNSASVIAELLRLDLVDDLRLRPCQPTHSARDRRPRQARDSGPTRMDIIGFDDA